MRKLVNLKKAISMLTIIALVSILLLAQPAFAEESNTRVSGNSFVSLAVPVYGDVSGDGKVSSEDAMMILSNVAGITVFSESQKTAADVSGDKKVTAGDATLVLRYVAGLITRFPVQDLVTTVSADAAGIRKILVQFSRPVQDLASVNITVIKNSMSIGLSKVSFSSDGMIAVAETTEAITAGEYVVNVTGIAAETLTASFTAANETIAKMELTPQNAFMSSLSANSVKAYFLIYNQYNEDITSVYYNTITCMASRGSAQVAAPGTIVITDMSQPFNVDEDIEISLLHPSTGITANAVLTVALPQITSIEIGNVTTDDPMLSNNLYKSGDFAKYYLPITVRDQFNRELDFEEIPALTMSVSDPAVLNLGSLVNKNSKPAIALAAPAQPAIAGTVDIILTAPSGITAVKTIIVGESSQIDTLEFSQPDIIVKQTKEFTVPFAAYDQYGRQLIKDTADLNYSGGNGTTTLNLGPAAALTTINVTGGIIRYAVDYVNNSSLLKVTPSADTTLITFTVITGTGKASFLSLAVSPAPVPTTIIGLDSRFDTAVQQGVSENTNIFDSSNSDNSVFIVKDQYGDPSVLWGQNATRLVISKVDETAPDNVEFDPNSITFKASTTLSGTTDFKAQLIDGNNSVLNEFTFTMESVNLKDITSFTIEGLENKVYSAVDSAHNVSFKLYGLKDSKKVKVAQYLVTTSTVSVPGMQVRIGYETLYLAVDILKDTGGKDEDGVIVITVATPYGTYPVTKPFVYSSAAPAAQYLWVRNNSTWTLDDPVIVAGKDGIMGWETIINSGWGFGFRFESIDQYGKDYIPVFNIAEIVDKNLVPGAAFNVTVGGMTAWGGWSPYMMSYTNAEAGDSFVITAVASNGLTKSVKVILRDGMN